MRVKCKKFISLIVSGALVGALSVTPATAYAASLADYIPSTASSTSGLLTGAATRAAMPSIEILGLSSVEESGQSIDLTVGSNGLYSNIYNWSQPKYALMATSLNSELSPYLANFAIGQGTMAVYNESRDGGNGPNAALDADDQTDQSVLALADLVVGNGDGADPNAVAYSFSNYSDLVATMYAIAVAADNLLTQPAYSNVSLRYDDVFSSATAIAELYEQYTMGTIGAVMEALSGEGDVTVPLRTVALVEDVWEDDDSGLMFQLMTGGSAINDGTASVNRYLETTVYTGISLSGGSGTLSLATNLADTVDSNTHTAVNPDTKESVIVVSADELASVNLIMVGGQQSSSNYGDIMEALEDRGLLSKTYFVENNSSAGAQYGVVMNSVENAQNVGRILGCLYPEVIDQQSWLAYYYENFYHIKITELTYVMNNALDGVRCWNATNTTTVAGAVEWNLSDAYSTSYSNSAAVETVLSTGLTYLCANTEYVSLAPSI